MAPEVDRAEVMRWRKAERERLIAARLATEHGATVLDLRP